LNASQLSTPQAAKSERKIKRRIFVRKPEDSFWEKKNESSPTSAVQMRQVVNKENRSTWPRKEKGGRARGRERAKMQQTGTRLSHESARAVKKNGGCPSKSRRILGPASSRYEAEGTNQKKKKKCRRALVKKVKSKGRKTRPA